MPRKAPTACVVPSCPGLSVRKGRCERHVGLADSYRPNSTERGYDNAWAKQRARILRESPSCYLCGIPSSEVHHIVSKRSGGGDNAANLLSLCKPCHSRITRAAQVAAKGK
jgi:5-methylcytosine-specific restriction protein A